MNGGLRGEDTLCAASSPSTELRSMSIRASPAGIMAGSTIRGFCGMAQEVLSSEREERGSRVKNAPIFTGGAARPGRPCLGPSSICTHASPAPTSFAIGMRSEPVAGAERHAGAIAHDAQVVSSEQADALYRQLFLGPVGALSQSLR